MHAVAALVLVVGMGIGQGDPDQTHDAKKEARPGQAELSVYPRLALWSPVKPVAVLILVTIKHPTPEFFCPAVELRIYGVGNEAGIPAMHKKYEGDCPPWSDDYGFKRGPDGEIIDITPTANTPWTWRVNSATERWGLGPGEWVVDVAITQGTKRQLLRVAVSVHGGE